MTERTEQFDESSREGGSDWPLVGFTMVGMKRLDNVQFCIENVLTNNVQGDFVETGVWRGGSSILAKAIFRYHGANNRIVWCCDSFAGMPTPDSKDLSLDPNSDFSDRSYLAVSEEQVANNFKKFGLFNENVRFVKGWFKDTLPTAPIRDIAVLRLDGDLYESTMDALTHLYDKVSNGGYVILDDYNWWPGCREAVNDFRNSRGIESPLQEIDDAAVFWQIISMKPTAATSSRSS